jgi:hypothetical protein
MSRISLIGTVHEESGGATTLALLDILRSIRPEVIFMEIPPESFPDFDSGSRSNLESHAARQYREEFGAVLVPVDMPTPEESFFRDWQYLDRRVTATSTAYRQLVDENTAGIVAHGFSYLNSERCRDAWSAIYKAIEIAIQRLLHDTRLPTIYEAWRRTNGLRDEAMLQGIYTHCSQNPLTTGVLLVGAAHANSIVNRSREGSQADTPHVDFWEPQRLIIASA